MSDPLLAPLSPAEEFALFHSQTPDRLDKIILHNLREAMDFVRKLCRNKFQADEQFSIAGMCLAKAALTYQPQDEEDTFLRFARPFLRGAVAQAWRSRDPVAYGDIIPPKLDPCETPRPLVDETVEPEFGQIDFSERWAVVKPYLSRLTNAEREVLTFHYEAGFSFADIAEMLGVTRAAPQQTHAKALLKLRNWLMESGDFSKLQ